MKNSYSKYKKDVAKRWFTLGETRKLIDTVITISPTMIGIWLYIRNDILASCNKCIVDNFKCQ